MKKVHTTHSGLDTTFLPAHPKEICSVPRSHREAELSHTASGSPGSRAAAPFPPPVGGALCEASPAPELGLWNPAEEVAGLRATEPACSPMLRALPRALRLSRPWRSPGARDCASNATTRTAEIQVHALTGPDQGKVKGRADLDPTRRRETKAGRQEDRISVRPRAERGLPDFDWGGFCLYRFPQTLRRPGGRCERRGELGAELCSRGSGPRRVLARTFPS